MIAWLRGRVIEKHPTRLIVDVHGVGYDVAVPVSTFYAAGEPGSEIELRVHTHVREDALSLFGFLTAFELAVFERLITISGIGPKLGLSVLSGIDVADFVTAVQRADVVRLTRIPGVGKKTAERICLELKDKLPVRPDGPAEAPTPSPPDALRDDLVSALVNLGYHRTAVDKVLDTQLPHGESERPRFDTALRAALRELARA
jgi:holliday junction DNA helicase RuvA